MKVCVVNPPWEEGDRWGIRAGCRFPNLTVKRTNSYVPFPFLVAYTASYLESNGLDVLLIDGVAERCGRDSFCDRIAGYGPDLIVAETSTTSLEHDLDLLEQIKARHAGTRVALYGPHVSVRPQDGLCSSAVDFVIVGEPEVTTLELARALEGGTDPGTIPGLARRDGPDAFEKTPPREPIADIDTLPFPKRDGLPMQRYRVPGFPSPCVFMYGSRGCPFRCTFCLWPQTIYADAAFRPRAAEKIVDEMAWVLERFPETRSFFFDDDTFNLGRTRLVAFADEMQRRGLRIPWGINARADNWDRELLERLVETGLFTLRIGIESGDPEVLERSCKGIDLEQAREMLHLSHELGILNHLSFVIGLPGESWDSVENTIRFIKSVPADSVQFSVAIPFPGTEFHRHVEENDQIVTHDWKKYNGYDHVVMRTESMTADELMKAITHARRRIYFSPRFIKRRLGYLRDTRDLAALTRKVYRLLFRRTGP